MESYSAAKGVTAKDYCGIGLYVVKLEEHFKQGICVEKNIVPKQYSVTKKVLKNNSIVNKKLELQGSDGSKTIQKRRSTRRAKGQQRCNMKSADKMNQVVSRYRFEVCTKNKINLVNKSSREPKTTPIL